MASTAVIKRQKKPAAQSGQNESFFATTFQGVEKILAAELKALGAQQVRTRNRGVSFLGDLSVCYKANLWSRTAHRILWHIATFDAQNKDSLYDGVRQINWLDHTTAQSTIAVDTVGTNDNLIHTQFTSKVIKDGIVDWFRDKVGSRPDVDLQNPEFRVSARILGNECFLSWDTSGERLHRRGYRSDIGGPAPLKENLAAAMLLMSGYNGKMPLIDPMCGSGTILVEAALIAQNRAPGSLGRRFGFINHPTYELRTWNNLLSDARTGAVEVEGCPIVGYDISDDAIRRAQAAATGSGTDDMIRLKRQSIKDMPVFDEGMIVTNPPYGERLGDINQLAGVYNALGNAMKRCGKGMSAHVITSSKFLAGKVGLQYRTADPLWNGALECRLLHYDIF
ncbi:MAG: RNA methyltransferase [Deltaproteobacteria bacterium]|nr:RNA methyltransferase [Deltaproteobacteria bacterium]MBN2672869.1 RNA methyltransferase [Deltaproteobacteria bacterium]